MSYKIKDVISLSAGLLIGFTFVASGTGKLFGGMQTPAQVMAFINTVLPDALLTPLFMDFIYKLLVPVVFPLAELVLGGALIVGLMPRLAAALTLPMIAAFMGTNIWTITTGKYSQCASCFGMWEKIFGHLAPSQSLGIDIVLGLLAVCVMALPPGRFFSSRWPVSRLFDRSSPGWQKVEEMPVLPPAANSRTVFWGPFDRLLVYIRRQGWPLAGYLLIIAGVILILITAALATTKVETGPIPSASQVQAAENITVSEVTTGSALITFITNSDGVIDIIVYDKNGKITGLFSDLNPVRLHGIKVDNLSPATTYYFQLLSGDGSTGKGLSPKHSFTTLEPPPVILNVSISKTTDSAAWMNWETDRPATTEVTYWEDGTDAKNTVTDDAGNTSHEAVLQPLDRERVYSFVIRARDAYGHQLIAEYEGVLSLKRGVQLIQRAPDFTLPTVAGDTLKLSTYRGRVVLLVFWNMTCPTCQKKMPLLQEAFDRLDAGKISIITVHGPGREAAIKSYCSSQGLTLPVALDLQGEAGSAFNVMLLPSLFILDQSGVIRSIDPEFGSGEELDSLLNQYLSR